MTSIAKRSAAFTAHTKPTVGDIKMSIVGLDHLGWLYCDGRSFPVSQFQFLFNVIGYSFGGFDASFNLPSPAGRVPAAVGQPVGVGVNHNLGDLCGNETHTLTIAQLPAHNHDISGGPLDVSNGVVPTANGRTDISGTHIHGITDPGHAHTYLGVNSQGAFSGGDNVAENDPRPTETTSTVTTGITINAAGAHSHQIASNGQNQPHNNIQPTIYIGNIFIYSGIPTYGAWPYQTGTNLF